MQLARLLSSLSFALLACDADVAPEAPPLPSSLDVGKADGAWRYRPERMTAVDRPFQQLECTGPEVTPEELHALFPAAMPFLSIGYDGFTWTTASRDWFPEIAPVVAPWAGPYRGHLWWRACHPLTGCTAAGEVSGQQGEPPSWSRVTLAGIDIEPMTTPGAFAAHTDEGLAVDGTRFSSRGMRTRMTWSAPDRICVEQIAYSEVDAPRNRVEERYTLVTAELIAPAMVRARDLERTSMPAEIWTAAAAACEGSAAADDAIIAAWFEPGAEDAPFPEEEVVRASGYRMCDAATGCTAWLPSPRVWNPYELEVSATEISVSGEQEYGPDRDTRWSGEALVDGQAEVPWRDSFGYSWVERGVVDVRVTERCVVALYHVGARVGQSAQRTDGERWVDMYSLVVKERDVVP